MYQNHEGNRHVKQRLKTFHEKALITIVALIFIAIFFKILFF